MKKSLLTDVLTANFAINSVLLALNKNNSSSEKKLMNFITWVFITLRNIKTEVKEEYSDTKIIRLKRGEIKPES